MFDQTDIAVFQNGHKSPSGQTVFHSTSGPGTPAEILALKYALAPHKCEILDIVKTELSATVQLTFNTNLQFSTYSQISIGDCLPCVGEAMSARAEKERLKQERIEAVRQEGEKIRKEEVNKSIQRLVTPKPRVISS